MWWKSLREKYTNTQLLHMTGQELKQTLQLLNLTQAKLAKHIGVDKYTVSRWVNDRAVIPTVVELYLYQTINIIQIVEIKER